jgi:hypothetical protein
VPQKTHRSGIIESSSRRNAPATVARHEIDFASHRIRYWRTPQRVDATAKSRRLVAKSM